MPYKTLNLHAACEALRTGGVIAFPTETYYGLGCDALNPDAVGSVYAMKKRPYGLPLPVIIGDMADIDRVAVAIHPLAQTLMEMYWPGSLSIIFTAAPEVPDLLTAGTGRIAVRVSPHPGSVALCRASGCVISASSANVSGNLPVTVPEDLDPTLGDQCAGIYVSSPPPSGDRPSTIVDILASGAGGAVRVLREGVIRADQLRAAGFTVVMSE